MRRLGAVPAVAALCIVFFTTSAIGESVGENVQRQIYNFSLMARPARIIRPIDSVAKVEAMYDYVIWSVSLLDVHYRANDDCKQRFVVRWESLHNYMYANGFADEHYALGIKIQQDYTGIMGTINQKIQMMRLQIDEINQVAQELPDGYTRSAVILETLYEECLTFEIFVEIDGRDQFSSPTLRSVWAMQKEIEDELSGYETGETNKIFINIFDHIEDAILFTCPWILS